MNRTENEEPEATEPTEPLLHAEVPSQVSTPPKAPPPPAPDAGTTQQPLSVDRRDARKARRADAQLKKRKATQDAQSAAATRRARQARSRRDKGRRATTAENGPPPEVRVVERPPIAPRPAQLTAKQAREFSPLGDLVGAVVYAWVWFDGPDPKLPGVKGKHRPCVVIAVSGTHLLVRACYSEGRLLSRSWKAYRLHDWEQAGLSKPGCVEAKARKVPRPKSGPPVGWLSVQDWNALW